MSIGDNLHIDGIPLGGFTKPVRVDHPYKTRCAGVPADTVSTWFCGRQTQDRFFAAIAAVDGSREEPQLSLRCGHGKLG
jgi:hypothetical protein